MLANKVDLAVHNVEQRQWEILAEMYQIPFLATSAKTGEGIEEAFCLLVKEIQTFVSIACCTNEYGAVFSDENKVFNTVNMHAVLRQCNTFKHIICS